MVLFAGLGRASHEGGSGLAGTLAVAAPFLIGAAGGWALARAWRRPAALATGAVVWAATVGVGMALRGLAFDRGTAPSFVLVAAIALGALMLGWRAAAIGARRGRVPR